MHGLFRILVGASIAVEGVHCLLVFVDSGLSQFLQRVWIYHLSTLTTFRSSDL